MAYKVGLTIIIASWLACLNPYWIIFAGPVLLIGFLVVWLSKVRLKTKILTTIFPILLWYPSVLAFGLLTSRYMTPETFLIPKNFRGKIILVYNETCGQSLPKINGRLTYKIPGNGLMISNNKFETGIIDQEFYFVDQNWTKINKIPTLIQQKFNEGYTIEKNKIEPSRNEVGVFLMGTGSASSLHNYTYKFHEMAVDSWDSLTARYEIYSSKPNDQFLDSMLYECRRKNYR